MNLGWGRRWSPVAVVVFLVKLDVAFALRSDPLSLCFFLFLGLFRFILIRRSERRPILRIRRRWRVMRIVLALT